MGADMECSGCERGQDEDAVVYCEDCFSVEVGPLHGLVKAIDPGLHERLADSWVSKGEAVEQAVATLQQERAVARELLEALEGVEGALAFHEGSAQPKDGKGEPVVWINNKDFEEALRSCRAAIAKARGGR